MFTKDHLRARMKILARQSLDLSAAEVGEEIGQKGIDAIWFSGEARAGNEQKYCQESIHEFS
ncbi:MAG: hypothetical protein JNM76_08320 [Betaproteobacteria bacterium]|nr:hypothetical protein [Betaproteobacteria bacterium]